MTTMTATVTDTTGAALKNEWVHFTLVSASMWNATGKYRVSRVASRLTDNAGSVSVDLPPNSQYADTGTFYRFEHGSTVDYFTVPDTGGPYNIFNRLRDPTPESTKFKITPMLAENSDATGLTAATDGQVPGYATATKTWVPVTRVTTQQLADGLAPKATTAAMNSADTLLQNRATSLESRMSTAETGISGKASSATVSTIDGKVTTNTGDISNLKTRVSNIEGGGTGGQAAPIHSGLRYLVTKADGTPADDHTQYHTDARGDARYYTQTLAQQTFAQLKHADRHKTGAADPITPAMIGASPSTHVLLDHPGSDQSTDLYPFAGTTAAQQAAAPSSAPDLRHAMIVSRVGAAGGLWRSVRQAMTHDYDVSGGVVPGSAETTIITFDFKTREACDLTVDLALTGYYSTQAAQPVGATGQVFVNVYILDRDNNNAVLWRLTGLLFSATVGVNNFRPINSMSYPLATTATVGAKRNLRLRIAGNKDANAPADILIQNVRGRVGEAALIGAG